MDTNATSFTSPLANAKYGSVNVPPQVEYIIDAVSNASGWTILFTLLAVAVAYDQSTSQSKPISSFQIADPVNHVQSCMC